MRHDIEVRESKNCTRILVVARSGLESVPSARVMAVGLPPLEWIVRPPNLIEKLLGISYEDKILRAKRKAALQVERIERGRPGL